MGLTGTIAGLPVKEGIKTVRPIMIPHFCYECYMESHTSELKARGSICLCYCGRRRRASFTTAIVGSFHITSSNSVQTTELSIPLKIYFWWSIRAAKRGTTTRPLMKVGRSIEVRQKLAKCLAGTILCFELGSLSNDDGDGTENGKKAIGLD